MGETGDVVLTLSKRKRAAPSISLVCRSGIFSHSCYFFPAYSSDSCAVFITHIIRSRGRYRHGLYDKLLLILSEHSVKSPWVEKEVETAFEKEQKSGKLTLFPVKLDNTVMETDQAWAADIRRMRHIGDFTRWKEHDEYQKGLTRLLRDLKQEAINDTIESDANKGQKHSNSREIQS